MKNNKKCKMCGSALHYNDLDKNWLICHNCGYEEKDRKTIKLTIEVCVDHLAIAYNDEHGTNISCVRPRDLSRCGLETVCETPDQIKKLIDEANNEK